MLSLSKLYGISAQKSRGFLPSERFFRKNSSRTAALPEGGMFAYPAEPIKWYRGREYAGKEVNGERQGIAGDGDALLGPVDDQFLASAQLLLHSHRRHCSLCRCDDRLLHMVTEHISHRVHARDGGLVFRVDPDATAFA